MLGPGRYAPDPTEGIVDVKDLPEPQQDFITATISKRPALAVVSLPLATNPTSESCTISAISPPVARLTSWYRIRRIIARLVRSISTSICPISPHPVAITPTA